MATIPSPLVIAGTAPASVSYTKMSQSANEVILHDRRLGISALVGTLKYVVAAVKSANGREVGRYRVGVKLMEPVVRTVEGIQVARTPNLFDGNFRFSEEATEIEKGHFVKLCQSAIAVAGFTAAASSGEAFF